MGNDALQVNADVFRQADLGITARGSDWYFAVCAVMTVSFLIVVGTSFTKPSTHRIFHYISAGILLTAAIAYFSMGSGLGQVPVQVEFVRPNNRHVRNAGTREIFWVRYVDWFITTPLLLMDLLLTAGLPWPTIMIAILADEAMVVCGLVGALVPTTYKWGYFTFATVAFLYVVWAILIEGRRHAAALGGFIKRTFNVCGVMTIFLWFLYPIAWGLSEGGNVIHPDGEAVFYGVLDLLAKPVFTGLLLWGHRNIDPAALGLHIREAGMPAGAIKKEHHSGDHAHIGEYNGQNTVAAGNHQQPTATTA
jgi:bacteriorhodopsin